jgi:hypothetical protein
VLSNSVMARVAILGKAIDTTFSSGAMPSVG